MSDYDWTVESVDGAMEMYHEGACKQIIAIEGGGPTSLGHLIALAKDHQCQSQAKESNAGYGGPGYYVLLRDSETVIDGPGTKDEAQGVINLETLDPDRYVVHFIGDETKDQFEFLPDKGGSKFPKKPKVGDKVTTQAGVLALPEGTVVDTGGGRRERTHPNDEWDMVMNSEEVLGEGNGSVTIVFLGA